MRLLSQRARLAPYLLAALPLAMSNTHEADHHSEKLLYAARAGDGQAIEGLLADAATYGGGSAAALLGASDPHSGNTALHMAAANGHVETLQRLVRAGAPLDARNAAGSVPLHYCAAGGSGDCARVLVEAGADLFVENRAGATPMDDALRIGGGARGDVAVVLMLAAEKYGEESDHLGAEGEEAGGSGQG